MDRPDMESMLRGLVQQLGGGDALKATAQAAANGDRDAAKRLMQSLKSTPDGAKLAAAIMNMLK